MKKLCTILAALTLVVLCVVMMPAEAEAASEDDLNFQLRFDGKSYSVESCNKDISGDLVIPATYNGKPVTGIGESAFVSCTGLTGVTIPSSVTDIGFYAFNGCSSLTSVTIPDSVTEIGNWAFYGCSSLTEVTIPASVTNIGASVFGKCQNLTGIWVDADNPVYCSDVQGVLYNKKMTTLIQAPGKLSGSYAVPSGVTYISYNAFDRCPGLTQVTVPGSVTKIGENAFFGCSSLTTLIFEENSRLTSIGRYAFGDCTGLEDIYITDPNAWCKVDFKDLAAVPQYTGGKLHIVDSNGQEIRAVILDYTVTSIPDCAFKNCVNQASVTISDSVTSIGACAFQNSAALTNLTIGNGVIDIGQDAFRGCSGLTDVVIGNNVTHIGRYAFEKCTGMTGLTIGNAVTDIGEYAFRYCTSLMQVTIPNSVQNIECEAFYQCTGLTTLRFAEGSQLQNLGAYAFYDCTNLADIYIYDPNAWCKVNFEENTAMPQYTGGKLHILDDNGNEVHDLVLDNTVVSIPRQAFENCVNLTSVTIPASATSIGNKAFANCTGLKSVIFSDGITCIGDWAFYYCTGLTSVRIPASVTDIQTTTFYGCWNLEKIIYCGTKEQWEQITIDDAWPTNVKRIFHNFVDGECTFCGEAGVAHVHTWIDATCTAPMTCATCGETEGEVLEHQYTHATCTAPKTCTVCGITEGQARGHFYRDATCTEPQICEYCGMTVGEPLGHSFSAATCTNPQICATCGATGEPALGHNYIGQVTLEPTCTTSGVKTYTCSVCFDVCTEVIYETGHSYMDATCTEPKTCSVCGYTAGLPLYHNCTWEITIEPTCKTAGEKLYTCTRCSYQYTETVRATGHSYIAATCTAPRTCSTCGVTSGRALGHQYTEEITVQATCKSTGTKTCTCSRCGDMYTEVIPVSGHSYNPATCTEPKTCAYCGYTNGKPLGHKPVTSADGKVVTCSRCDIVLERIEDDTHEHNYVDGVCTVCGEKDPNAPLTDPNLKFMGDPGLSFQEYIGLQVMFKNSVAKEYDKFYVEIKQVTPDGTVVTTSTGTPYTSSYTVFEQQIVSWSMTEQVTMTLYGEKDGILYQGASITTSVRNVAMNKIPGYIADGDLVRTRALVDMLNYGAAVQSAYEYNVSKLANAGLSKYQDYGTTAMPEMTAVNKITGTNKIQVLSHNISLQANVELQLMVKTKDIEGKLVVPMLDGKVVPVAYTTYGSYTIIRVAVGAANMRDTYKLAVYDTDGKPLTCIYKVSVEAYAKEKLSDAKADAYIAMMRYGDAIAAIA